MTVRHTTLGLLVLLIAGPSPAQTPTAAAPRFRLAGGTVQLSPGQTEGTVTLSVFATLQAADIQLGAHATLTDETPNSAGATVTASPVKTSSEPQQVWRFTLNVKGLGRADSQTRVFALSYGKIRERLEYTLSNTTAKTFTWSVKMPSEWNLESMDALSVSITVGEVAATGVALHQIALSAEDRLKRTLGTEHFQLCTTAKEACVAPAATLPTRVPQTLYVRTIARPPAGVYKGNILISTTEKTDPEVFAVTLYSARRYGRIMGLGALLLGVLGSFFLQILVRAWIQQRQDKSAIALLRKRLAQVVVEFDRLPDKIKTAAERWTAQAKLLQGDMKELDDLVRSLVPQPFADEVTAVETLKLGLERHSKSVLHLRTLLRDGLQPVVAMVKDNESGATPAAKAARDIAAISPVEDVTARIRAILAELRQSVGATTVPKLAGDTGSATAEFQSLRLQISALSLLAYAAWAIISVLSGALLLVYQSPAFGSEVDLLVCLAWGLGVTVAGQQASQMVPANVAQSIGLKLPGGK
ncbi:hypothetical protein BH18ACI5_BH18ACI5_06740 [soil metagenome]